MLQIKARQSPFDQDKGKFVHDGSKLVHVFISIPQHSIFKPFHISLKT